MPCRMSREPLFAVLILSVLCLVALVVSGCGASDMTVDTTEAGTPSTALTGTTASPSTSIGAELEPIVAPTLPEQTPGYTEADPATGLHVTGIPSVVDLASYRLKVTGKVVKELGLTYDQLRALPKVTASPTLVCPGAFVDHATWSGVPLSAILEMAGMQPGAKRIRMEGADGYSSVLTMDEALQPQNFLAYELEGETLPALHGFPLRAVIPAHIGAFWVKWILEIQVE